jgi:hypothetical protein
MRVTAAALLLAYAYVAFTRADHLAPLAISLTVAFVGLSVVAQQLRRGEDAGSRKSSTRTQTRVGTGRADNDNGTRGSR